jgi:hypothetical protein
MVFKNSSEMSEFFEGAYISQIVDKTVLPMLT